MEVIGYLAVAAVHKDRNSSESVKSSGETAQLFAAMAYRTASHKASCTYYVLPTLSLLSFNLTLQCWDAD